jgi:hypothetical protein
VHNFFSLYFGWYQGSVYSNLLASLLWGLPAGFGAVVHLKNHQQKLHNERMEQAQQHHEALMDAIDKNASS